MSASCTVLIAYTFALVAYFVDLVWPLTSLHCYVFFNGGISYEIGG